MYVKLRRIQTTRESTRTTNVTPTPQSTILSMLHGRASLRPGDVAFTFTDYVHDPAGVSESLTWSQLSRRTLNVARELSRHASVGDRAVILAPQSLDYIAAFLGSMQAGLIAVPLPLPHRSSSDDRLSAVFDDASPTVVLTTSAVADDIAEYLHRGTPGRCPEDHRNRLDESGRPDDPGALSFSTADLPSTAYLQYSSGSTRLPTGVMISHRNLQVNFEQLMRSYFADSQINHRRCHFRVVAALLPRHGSGPGHLRTHPERLSRRAYEPGCVLGKAGQMDTSAG